MFTTTWIYKILNILCAPSIKHFTYTETATIHRNYNYRRHNIISQWYDLKKKEEQKVELDTSYLMNIFLGNNTYTSAPTLTSEHTPLGKQSLCQICSNVLKKMKWLLTTNIYCDHMPNLNNSQKIKRERKKHYTNFKATLGLKTRYN